MEIAHSGFIFLTAMLVCMGMIPVVLKVATAQGLYDLPDRAGFNSNSTESSRRVHSSPIPRLGGIAIFLSFLVTYFVWSLNSRLGTIFGVSLIVFAIGLLDDLVSAPANPRLIAQIICSVAVVYFANLGLTTIDLIPNVTVTLSPVVGMGLSTFIIVGAIHAINMADGLDGLAGGVVLIGIALLSFIHVIRTGDLVLLMTFGLPLIGALLGFLRYNTFPARIFLGDCGSNWLGFMTGILLVIVLSNHQFDFGSALIPTSLNLGFSLPPRLARVPILSAIMCLAVPIADTAFVIIKRLWGGTSPFRADCSHFHHTLLRMGLTHAQSVTAIYFLSFTVGILAVLPVAYPNYNVWLFSYSFGLLLTLGIPVASMSTGQYILMLLNSRFMISRSTSLGGPLRKVLRVWNQVNRFTMYAILLSCPIFASVAPKPVGQMAAISALVILISLFVTPRSVDLFDSLLLSIGAGVIFLANNQSQMTLLFGGSKVDLQWLYNGAFVFLGISTLLYLAITIRKRHFIISPSDFLLMGLPLIILLVPEPIQSDYLLSIIAMRCLIFFTAIRTMARNEYESLNKFRYVCLIALLYITLTSLFNVPPLLDYVGMIQ